MFDYVYKIRHGSSHNVYEKIRLQSLTFLFCLKLSVMVLGNCRTADIRNITSQRLFSVYT